MFAIHLNLERFVYTIVPYLSDRQIQQLDIIMYCIMYTITHNYVQYYVYTSRHIIMYTSRHYYVYNTFMSRQNRVHSSLLCTLPV